MTSDPSVAAWFGSRKRDNGVKTITANCRLSQIPDHIFKGDNRKYLRHIVTLVWLIGVLVQLTNLPVKIGVPGS